MLNQQQRMPRGEMANWEMLKNMIKALLRQSQMEQSYLSMLQSGTLATILMCINHEYFSHLKHSSKSYEGYIYSIDRYLTQRYNMRIELNYKRYLCQNNSMAQIVTLILFLVFKSSPSQQYIQLVYNLHGSLQAYTLARLKDIQANIQDLQKVNILKRTVMQLQAQNDSLDLCIKQAKEQSESLMHDLDILAIQNKIRSQQQINLKQEKRSTLEKLGIAYQIQYSSILNDRYEQQKYLIKENQNIELQLQRQSQIGGNLREKMYQNELEINHLHQEKQYWQSKKQNASSFILQSTENPQILGSQNLDIQAQNKNLNAKYYEKRGIVNFQFFVDIKQQLQMLKAAQKKIEQLTLQRSHLKQENTTLECLIKKKQSKLNAAMRQHASIWTNTSHLGGPTRA